MPEKGKADQVMAGVGGIRSSYRPAPVRRVKIPKASGGYRGLGIPTVKDRVVQMAVYLVLMPIFEADFHPFSFGFRPGRGAIRPWERSGEALRMGKTDVVDADLTQYFDTIPHQKLMQQVARGVSDGMILKLIKAWLRAPILDEEEGGGRKMKPNPCGTPQGGVISPLLANIYFHPLDEAVNERSRGGSGHPRLGQLLCSGQIPPELSADELLHRPSAPAMATAQAAAEPCGKVSPLAETRTLRKIRTLLAAYSCGIWKERSVKEPGKPDAGNPPVRFDEGREADGHCARASQPVASCLLYTEMIPGQTILKTDARGRVHVPVKRREALLDEFDKSGLSAKKFALLIGMKHQTFATWATKRRKERGIIGINRPSAQRVPELVPKLQWVEAVVEKDAHTPGSNSKALSVHLPGGARLEIGEHRQVALAAQLLRALTDPRELPC